MYLSLSFMSTTLSVASEPPVSMAAGGRSAAAAVENAQRGPRPEGEMAEVAEMARNGPTEMAEPPAWLPLRVTAH